ncbi:EscU/YscU/HrcU family type III secretion system export apparatus switch protein [Marispirochaeta sp.]|jgi:flagellar biosynthesis protein|uniref:EscU/YscU/HrcU family type III secretion system export apparatus switch protein n=1 Tax=Marispirochaeta sp. TaxID=2038653 RepID=UPI0029C73209|nr:EscU/YscU/HrcU family type III secretion system export apparatus switch protein [Marispirochaeta sp.]
MKEFTQQQAVSLKYDPAMPAPFVSAKAKGFLAQRMIDIAEESGIPILSAGKTAEDLFFLDPGELIPEYLFAVVAEIFAFIYSVQES